MRPVIQILKGGTDLMPGLAPYFIRASISDAVGIENDALEIELDDIGRQIPLPVEGDELTVLAGYAETGVSVAGIYVVQGWGSGWQGGPETMVMQARAASLSTATKAGGRKHYDERTLKAIFADIAKEMGLSLVIDAALSSVKLDWLARWEASPQDFATRLAEEHGAVAKPGGGKLSVTKRGSGKAASGEDLPIIRVQRRGSLGWSINGEPRPRVGKVTASWHDAKTGRSKTVEASTGKDGPAHSIIHPRASEAEAKAAAEAKARELTMLTGSGHFIETYDPTRSAGAKVIATGFGDGVDGEWVSETIEATFDKDGGAIQVINVKAPPE
ncbi:hypothetical protein C3941_09520 [Kaistia algarum]|uniref:phage late control D family protein n=1 Tax=Kaistia algarum TaxID=2083279 RepID=UPI000CE9122D|nr:contractile injection system protein, VgrG/Pvc8 family [Kaistia algarum]MCX5512297.1 contractile injection system protein, VgrG/Pvc8 family [Kaistia algarum]PPE80387.1 hypothetical protein C3941_09520 [Kaistia algarum]